MSQAASESSQPSSPTTPQPPEAMLDLFCQDVRHHATLIGDSLHLPDAPQVWDSARHSAHAIWGSARLLELIEIAELLRVIRDNFQISKALSNTRKIQLHEAIEWLLELAEVPPKKVNRWLEKQQPHLQHLFENLTTPEQGGTQATAADTPAEPALEPASGSTDAKTTSAPNLDTDAVSNTANQPLPSSHQITDDIATSDLEAFDLSHIDAGLLELFLSEVETHVDILNEGLLVLENQPNAKEQLEAMMRGAHSIKGGARVVGLDNIVGLAHHMEDCFVAAQKDKLRLDSSKIDVLLQSCDLFTRMVAAARQQDGLRLAHCLSQTKPLERQLQALLSGKAIVPPEAPHTPTTEQALAKTNSQPSASLPATPPDEVIYTRPRDATVSPESPAPSQETPQETTQETSQATASSNATNTRLTTTTAAGQSEKDRIVRVSANKIERLMGLTGEVTVSARWLPPYSNSMLQLKRSHLEIASLLEKLQDKLSQAEVEPLLLKDLLRIREKNKQAANYLNERLNSLDVFTSTLSTHSDRLYREMISVRMRPFADGVRGLPRLVRDLSRQLGKKVQFEIIGKTTEVDQDILEKLDAPLNHLLRNALDHGLETPPERLAANKSEVGHLSLEAAHRSGLLMITLSDDGRGINMEKLRDKVKRKGLVNEDLADKLSDAELMEFLFLPGFSTSSQVTEISGRGVGLDVVHSMVHEVGGQVRAESQHGKGLTFHLDLPLTLSVIRTFLVDIAGEPYAFPLARIDRCLQLAPDDIQVVEERQYFRFSGNNIALVNIHDVLELDSSPPPCQDISVVMIGDRFNAHTGSAHRAYGLVVDKFLGEYDLVVRPLDTRLGKVPDINAVAVMLDGSPVLIFDVEDLVHSIDKMLGSRRLRKINRPQDGSTKRRKQILVADDSITIRELERKMLEHQGYQVDVAVDGLDAWSALRSGDYDLLVSDIDMPRMDGISLIHRVREHQAFQHLPIVVVSYKDSEQHRLQGMQAGANYYLTKSSFEDDSFVRAIIDLIGEA